MTEGAVQWNDKNYVTKNRHTQGGATPDGGYDTIYYCCQNKGKWFSPIDLPIHRPFYLLPHNNSVASIPRCQHVNWAMSSLEYIDYNTRDKLYVSQTNKYDDRSYGDHVFNIRHGFLQRSYMRVYYCYYQGKVVARIRYTG